MPGQIGSAYVSQPLSKEIRNFYGNEINKVMSRDFTAARPTVTTPVPVSTLEASTLPPVTAGTPAVSQAVAPPRKLQASAMEPVNFPPLLDPTRPAAPVVAPAPVQAAVPPPAPVPAPAPAAAPAKKPAKAASLPKGVPAGSVDTGKYSKDGKKVYRDRSGQLHTGD
jgi:hypothetical protein